MDYNAALVVLLVALSAPILVVLAGSVRVRLATPVAIGITGLAFAVTAASYWNGEDRFDVAWAPAWDVRFSVALDGLARMYAMLATGVGLAVVIYASRYLPLHLKHEHRPQGEIIRFYVYLLLFMGAMVGLVMSQDMILLFVFWDLTAIASFFLIGFDRNKEASRSAALMALLMTGISAVCVLIGALLLWNEHGTFALEPVLSTDTTSAPVAIAAVLIAIGALTKSAQVPVHFWLPNAMAAPTPVSAYLHSAAMVAAGVFLVGRTYPLMARFDWLLDGFVAIGLLSMAVGGILALTRDVLKQVLAYSTISQYGYVVFLFGIGGEKGVAAATFYVIAHALAKSALFLTAGAVTEATGRTNLSAVGGLARRMPLLAWGSGFAAAGLVGLPLTGGFFKDEFYFGAAWDRHPVLGVAAVAGAMLTFTYICRFWFGIFGPLGSGAPVNAEPKPITRFLVWPTVILGLLVVIGGIWFAPIVTMANQAATVSLGHDAHLHAAYHLDLRAENVMAVAVWSTGSLMLLGRRVWWPMAMTVARIGQRVGPERAYDLSLEQLNRLSDRLHDIEVRDLRSRIASILVPAGVLVGLAVYVTPSSNQFFIGEVSRDDAPSILMLALAIFAAISISLPRDHLNIALVLSCVGYSLSVLYAFMGAPNVALVAVLIETVFSLLFIGMLILMPRSILRYESARRPERLRIRRDAVLAVIAGVMAFFVVWGALSKPAADTTVIDRYVELTPIAHGKNVVTVILADFRGLDTAGEITVISIGLLGILSLLRVGRLR